MITFKEFDEAIANVAIDAVFPTKRDLYMKPVYSHDNKDDKIGMTYVIMPFESKNYYIGFIHEQSSSMFTMWNGKLNHIVFDVDERDGCIRYYHEPELYDRDHGLSHSQIQTIGEALIKYLTSNKEEKDDNEPEETKKKHPLQNSPTFPEEESAECEVTCKQENQETIMNKKDILKDLFNIIYDWIKPIITGSDTKLGGSWDFDSYAGAFYWRCSNVSSATVVHIGARLYEDDILIWTKNKDNVTIVVHPVERSVFTDIYSVDVMLNSTAEFEEFSKEEMEDLYNRIIDFNKEKHHAVIHSEEKLSDQYTSMSIQDVPEGRAICEKTLEKDTMEESKELPPFVKTRCIPGFDTDALKIGHPYRVTSERYGEQIMFLNRSSETLLHFFKLIVYDGEVQRQEEYLVSIDNVVNDGYIIQEMN